MSKTDFTHFEAMLHCKVMSEFSGGLAGLRSKFVFISEPTAKYSFRIWKTILPLANWLQTRLTGKLPCHVKVKPDITKELKLQSEECKRLSLSIVQCMYVITVLCVG